MNIFHSVAELAGNTPLLELCRYERRHGLNARILAKLECCNVAGSAKDRVAKHMIERAEAEGKLVPGSVIIEPTSGNTGIGLAAMAKVHGYRVILTMPESMSVERRNLLKAYGAELVLTPAAEGMAGAVKCAEELAAATPRSFIPAQFDNPANPEAHYLTTGPELWRDTDGCVDLFVAGIGTLSQGEKSGREARGRRAGGLAAALGRQSRSARTDGHRSELHPEKYGHFAHRRDHLCPRGGRLRRRPRYGRV